MSAGQTISVKVNKGDLEVSGDVDVTMLDTQSKAFTMFSFMAIRFKTRYYRRFSRQSLIFQHLVLMERKR